MNEPSIDTLLSLEVKIHYTGQQGGPFGWGQFGANMVKQWRSLNAYAERPEDADCIFHVASNPDFEPLQGFRGRFGDVNFGMAFFESELGPRAAEYAKRYDVLFVGSTWCKERCVERGIHNTEVLIQGVDRSIFNPFRAFDDLIQSEKDRLWSSSRKQFRIFSGGKFEYRKGQDLVIGAFREFAKDHPEAHLVCAWFNPWFMGMHADFARMNLRWPSARCGNQEEWFGALLLMNGLRSDQFTILPQLSQRDLAREMANTDCGLFPNRCEGGTNLVLMEYAACGGAVVANLGTGHADIPELIEQDMEYKEDKNHWAWSDDDDIRDGLHGAYYDRTTFPNKPIPTWESAAKQVYQRALTFNRGETILAAHDAIRGSI